MSRKIFLPRPEERNFSCLPAPVRYARCSVVLSCPFVLGFLQLFHLGSCIFISSDDADQSLKLSKPCGCACQPWIYLRLGGLVLFRVVREGIGISQRLSASGTCAPTGDWDTHPRTRASQEPPATTRKITGDGRLLTRDAQAACDFSFVASKFSPFFHRVSVMAAILRARVRRTIVGLMPFASDLW